MFMYYVIPKHFSIACILVFLNFLSVFVFRHENMFCDSDMGVEWFCYSNLIRFLVRPLPQILLFCN